MPNQSWQHISVTQMQVPVVWAGYGQFIHGVGIP
jgi:hypothetical protein